MKRGISIILLLITLTYLPSCSTKSQSHHQSNHTESVIPVHYAQGFRLWQGDGYKRIDIVNPWDTTQLLRSYIVVQQSDSLPQPMPQGQLIRVPLSQSVVFSSVHCSLLHELDCLSAIAGICDSEFIYIDTLLQRLNDGTLIDAGNSTAPDIERIIALSPDAILLSPYENNSYERLEKTQIPIIECADYMENSPLGRAEWMRMIGILYGCEKEADSLFSSVIETYTSVCKRIAASDYRPKVISERRTGSVWYVPGGESYMATMFADAGAIYPWHDNKSSGSIALSFENVFDSAQDADVWLIKYNNKAYMTYSSLQQEYAPYSRFEAFKRKRIFGCNTHYYRYYEETPFHPDRLLQDLGAIFHPDLFPQYKPYYYHPLDQ